MHLRRVLNPNRGGNVLRVANLRLEDIQDEIVARPSSKGPKWTKSRKELIIPCKMTLADKLNVAPVHIPALCDSGSQVPLIAGYELFDESALEDAPLPIVLVGAGKSCLRAGSKGVRVNLLIPICEQDGTLRKLLCTEVFVCVANIGKQLIIGYPFMVHYGLAIAPGYPSFLRLSVRKRRRPAYQHGQSMHAVSQEALGVQTVNHDEVEMIRNCLTACREEQKVYSISARTSKVHWGIPSRGFEWTMWCLNPLCDRVCSVHSRFGDPFHAEIPYFCEQCHPRVEAQDSDVIFSPSPMTNPPSTLIRYDCGPKCQWPQYEEKWKKWYTTRKVEEMKNRRKGVPTLNLRVLRDLPQEAEAIRPPSPVGIKGTTARNPGMEPALATVPSQVQQGQQQISLSNTNTTSAISSPSHLHVMFLSPNAIAPTSAYDSDAGYDLYCSESTEVPAWGKAKVPTGIACYTPPGTYGRIADRSGMAWKHDLQVRGGVVDHGYRGHVQIILFNHSGEARTVHQGDRCAQIIFEQYVKPSVKIVSELPETDRGHAGFGSTGVSTPLRDIPEGSTVLTLSHTPPPSTPNPTEVNTLIHTLVYYLIYKRVLSSEELAPILPGSAQLEELRMRCQHQDRAQLSGGSPESLPGAVQPVFAVLTLILTTLLVLMQRVADAGGETASGPTSPMVDEMSPSKSPTVEPAPQSDVTVDKLRLSCQMVKRTQVEAKGPEILNSSTVELPPHPRVSGAFAPDSFQGNWGYPRVSSDGAGVKVPTLFQEVANLQELDVWADVGDPHQHVPVARVVAVCRNLEARLRDATPHISGVPGVKRDTNLRLKAQARARQRNRKQPQAPIVRPQIITRISKWTATISPDNEDFQLSLDLFGNPKLSVLESTTGGPKQAYFCDWGSEPVSLCPPPCDSEWDRCITKVFLDGSKGIAIMPVRKTQKWFWGFGRGGVGLAGFSSWSAYFL